MPLADAFRVPGEGPEPEPRYPLAVSRCTSCGLVQLVDVVDPALMFGEGYLYLSSSTDGLVRSAAELAGLLIEQRRLGGESLVVEIASNDGVLLEQFARRGVPVLGIEPAAAAAAAAEARGIPTVREFFGAELAAGLRADGVRADVVVANNVLAHTPDPNGFVRGLALLLADDGVASIEVQYLRDLLELCAFDTIYHEHVSYFSCAAARRLLDRHALVLRHVERVPRQGGSLRLTCARGGLEDGSVRSLLEQERDAGLGDPRTFAGFSARVDALVGELRAMLARLHGEGLRLAAYGAAAKGTILLNALGVEPGLVEFVADRNPRKQGRLVPGVGTPIRDPDALVAELPDVALLLAWNLEQEVLAQQAEYRRRGGRFLVPIPRPRLV